MVSQTAEYALRAVVDLSYHAGESRTSQQIARATKVPAGYLAKILQDLGKHNIVRSQRGLGGGFTLANKPSSITVFDVLDAVDPPRRIRACPLGLSAHRDRLCPLHQKLDDAMAAAEKAFRQTTIADVTANPNLQPIREKPAVLTISGGLSNRAGQSGKRRSSKR